MCLLLLDDFFLTSIFYIVVDCLYFVSLIQAYDVFCLLLIDEFRYADYTFVNYNFDFDGDQGDT